MDTSATRLLAITKTTEQISDGTGKAGATGQMRRLKNEAPEFSFSLLLGWNADHQVACPGFEK